MNIIKYFSKKCVDRKKSIKYIICWSLYSVSFLFEEKKAINDIFYCRLLTEALITSVDEFLIDFNNYEDVYNQKTANSKIYSIFMKNFDNSHLCSNNKFKKVNYGSDFKLLFEIIKNLDIFILNPDTFTFDDYRIKILKEGLDDIYEKNLYTPWLDFDSFKIFFNERL